MMTMNYIVGMLRLGFGLHENDDCGILVQVGFGLNDSYDGGDVRVRVG